MSTKMKELLQEQTTADQADNSDSNNGSDNKEPLSGSYKVQNWTRLQINGTPFWVIGNDEQGYNIIMGKWKLTNNPIFPDPQALNHEESIVYEATQWLTYNQWNTILSMIICATTDIEKQKQN